MFRQGFASGLLFLGLFLQCGGLDLNHAKKTGFFDPEKWFPGKKTGYGVSYDRNGNVMQSFLVKRACVAPEATSGVCLDQFSYANRLPREAEMKYKLEYMDNLDVALKLEFSSDEIISGKVYGGNLILEGQKKIPDSEALSPVFVHIHKMMGPGDPAMQKETYSYAGLKAGSVEIFWQQSEE